MKMKPNVRIEHLCQPLKDALPLIEATFNDYDSLLTITAGHEGSASDKVHLPNSKHYSGQAIDCRGRHLTADTLLSIDFDLSKRLGGDFDVVAEIKDKMGHPKNHIHIEYDPKGAANG